MKAQDALNKAIQYEFGNTLEPKKLQRPTPFKPGLFKVLSKTLTVRKGRTLDSKILHALEKKRDERIIVNRTKGRRARLSEKRNGFWEDAGWVSLFSSKGVPLLMQLEDADYSTENRMDLVAAQRKKNLLSGGNRYFE